MEGLCQVASIEKVPYFQAPRASAIPTAHPGEASHD